VSDGRQAHHRDRWRRRRAATAALAVYALAAVLATWPLAAHIRSRAPATPSPASYPDTLLISWMLSWDVHQLLRAPLRLYDANIAHPLHATLAYSEAFLSEALLVLPLAPLTPCPVLLLNAATLATFVLGSFGAFLLVRHLTGNATAAFVGGLLFGLVPYRFWAIDRLNALAVFWTPFLLLAWHRYLEAGGSRRWLALVLAFLVQMLTTVYVAYGTVVLLPLYLVGWRWLGPTGERARWALGVGALAVGGVIAAAVSLPYLEVRDEMALSRDPVQLLYHSVPLAEIGRMATSVPGYLISKLTLGVKGAGVVGVASMLLLALGVVAGGTVARLYAVLALAALVLALGPVVVLPWGAPAWVPGPYRLLYDWVPGFAALREPRRFMGFVAAFSALGAGLGAAALVARLRTRRARSLATGALVALIVLEVGWAPLPLRATPEIGLRRRLYERIVAGSPGAVVELPAGSDVDLRVAMFRSAYHFRPLVNGSSGFNPTGAELRRRTRRFPDRRSVEWLRELGIRFIVYDTRAWRARSRASLARRLRRAAPEARLVDEADGAVLIEVEPLPPRAPPTPPGELARDGWRVRASEGDAAAAIDGDLRTHWVAAVDAHRGGGWYEVDFGREVEVGRLRIELDSHYGEQPRAWRVLAGDGTERRAVAARRFPPAPLASYRADRHRVVVDLLLPPTRARLVRIEVPPLALPGRTPPFDVPMEYWLWSRWGIHELRAYAPRSASGG
jgi:F5/8 type C domain-containing protein